MDIAQLEIDISERLGQIMGIAGLQIIVVAQKQSDYKKAFEKPQITVMLREMTYEKPAAITDNTQRATAVVEVILQSRWLRSATDHTGIYELYDKARLALLGFRPANYDKIYGVDFRFESFEENVFTYCFVVATRTTAVEEQSDPNADFPRVTQIIYLDN